MLTRSFFSSACLLNCSKLEAAEGMDDFGGAVGTLRFRGGLLGGPVVGGVMLEGREGKEGRIEVAEGTGREGLEREAGTEGCEGREDLRPIMVAADVCFSEDCRREGQCVCVPQVLHQSQSVGFI